MLTTRSFITSIKTVKFIVTDIGLINALATIGTLEVANWTGII